MRKDEHPPKGLWRRWNEHEIKQDGLDCSCGSRLTQIVFVLSGEFPCVMDIGKMHDFDFVAFIQRQPELVFAEQRLCFHCLFAFVADCLYGRHASYGTLALRATQAKPAPSQLSKMRVENPPAAPDFTQSKPKLAAAPYLFCGLCRKGVGVD